MSVQWRKWQVIRWYGEVDQPQDAGEGPQYLSSKTDLYLSCVGLEKDADSGNFADWSPAWAPQFAAVFTPLAERACITVHPNTSIAL